ncbi:MAG: complex I subunit 5 family protein [Trueperaceae bacterium]
MDHFGPLLLALGPALAAFAVAAVARRDPRRAGVVAAWVATAAVAGVAALAPDVLASGAVTATLPAALGALRFTLDGVGLAFAAVAAVAWAVVSWYAVAYLAHDPRAGRYHVAGPVVLSAMLGVVVAGDWITLYVFFEWLGLSAYLWVVHAGDARAERAATKYLVLTLLGGFSVLVGVLILHAAGAGDLVAGAAADAAGLGAWRGVAGVALVVGFGVKAGALGLHLWLPDAHTAAPAPASALLSGVMVKAGAYGILRALVAFHPADGGAAEGDLGAALALAVIVWGVATMLVGGIAALGQTHAKRLLAYSTVSQMGYVLVGIGSAAYLGAAGAIGWTGTVVHVAQHAAAKGLLFLGIGALVHAAGETDLRRLGGLARRMPWTTAAVLVGAAGIAGVPGGGGYVGKTIVHHALDYAREDAAGHGVGRAFGAVEPAFVLATVATAALLAKLVALAFFGPPRSDGARTAREVGLRWRVPMALLAAAVLGLGLAPTAVAPWALAAATALGATPDAGLAGVRAYLAGPLAHAPDLRAALGAIAAGMALHALLRRSGAYERTVPGWLSLDRWATVAVAVGVARGRRAASAWDAATHALAHWRQRGAAEARAALLRPRHALAEAPLRVRDRIARAVAWVAVRSTAFERSVNRLDATRWLRESPPDVAAGVGADRDRWVLATRRRIARHGRDLGLGIGVAFALWFALVVLVAFGG